MASRSLRDGRISAGKLRSSLTELHVTYIFLFLLARSSEPRKYSKLNSRSIWLEPRPSCPASACSCWTASIPTPTTWCAPASFTRNHTKSAAYCDWNRTSKLRWAWLEHEHEFEAVAAKNSLCLDKCLGSVWRLPKNLVRGVTFGDAWTERFTRRTGFERKPPGRRLARVQIRNRFWAHLRPSLADVPSDGAREQRTRDNGDLRVAWRPVLSDEL